MPAGRRPRAPGHGGRDLGAHVGRHLVAAPQTAGPTHGVTGPAGAQPAHDRRRRRAGRRRRAPCGRRAPRRPPRRRGRPAGRARSRRRARRVRCRGVVVTSASASGGSAGRRLDDVRRRAPCTCSCQTSAVDPERVGDAVAVRGDRGRVVTDVVAEVERRHTGAALTPPRRSVTTTPTPARSSPCANRRCRPRASLLQEVGDVELVVVVEDDGRGAAAGAGSHRRWRPALGTDGAGSAAATGSTVGRCRRSRPAASPDLRRAARLGASACRGAPPSKPAAMTVTRTSSPRASSMTAPKMMLASGCAASATSCGGLVDLEEPEVAAAGDGQQHAVRAVDGGLEQRAGDRHLGSRRPHGRRRGRSRCP